MWCCGGIEAVALRQERASPGVGDRRLQGRGTRRVCEFRGARCFVRVPRVSTDECAAKN